MKRFFTVQFNNPRIPTLTPWHTAQICGVRQKPQNAAKARTYLLNAAFHATPHHSAPRRTIPRHAAPFRATPRDAALVLQLLWQIPH
jgi:hypothetical protein